LAVEPLPFLEAVPAPPEVWVCLAPLIRRRQSRDSGGEALVEMT
jgi:hypothetical protein